jgi:glutathione synthase
MRSLWVTDAWETLDHPRDTTLRLVEESLRLGHAADWCDTSSLRFERGRVLARCCAVQGVAAGRHAGAWRLAAAEDVDVTVLDAVHYRTDPPVDRHYWEHLQLLAFAAARGRPEIVNPVDVLARRSDKLGPPALAPALPPTIVSSSWECLAAFGRAEGRTVLKPMGGAQSRDVELLDWRSPSGVDHARLAVERTSDGFSRPVVLQRFLDAVLEGEKRLWFVDGALLAHVRKRPVGGSFVIDVDKGSRCEPCELTDAEARLAGSIGDALASERVRLAAVDVIAGHVTDWNVTSPGMIPLMERLLERNLAREIVERLARAR